MLFLQFITAVNEIYITGNKVLHAIYSELIPTNKLNSVYLTMLNY